MRRRPARPISAGVTRSAPTCCSPTRWSRTCGPGSKADSPRWCWTAISTSSWKRPWRSASASQRMWRRTNSPPSQQRQQPLASLEKGLGVDGAIAVAHFEMQMRSGGTAGRADTRNRGAGIDRLALGAEKAREVGVSGGQPVGVGNFHDLAIARLDPDEGHDAIAGAEHRGAAGGGEVEAGMKGAPARKRIGAIAKA